MKYPILPDPEHSDVVVELVGRDHHGQPFTTSVIQEVPLTLFLNSQEILTLMTIGDHPELLGAGFLFNQGMLQRNDNISAIDYDPDTRTLVVRTPQQTSFEDKMKKKTRTSGCAQGTVFGDLMETIDTIYFDDTTSVKTSWLYQLQKTINTIPSLYLKTGAIHGCVLCQNDVPLVYMEDVGRHNAVDKIAGHMVLNAVDPAGKFFYTTGRLTSEMVIKTARMGISVLISRSGFTAWGVELAQKTNMTLIGRLRGERFAVLSGHHRMEYDHTPAQKQSSHSPVKQA